MASNLPRYVYIDREAIIRPNICSHVARANEFEPGIKAYLEPNRRSNEFLKGFLVAIFASAVFGLFLLAYVGVI